MESNGSWLSVAELSFPAGLLGIARRFFEPPPRRYKTYRRRGPRTEGSVDVAINGEERMLRSI